MSLSDVEARLRNHAGQLSTLTATVAVLSQTNQRTVKILERMQAVEQQAKADPKSVLKYCVQGLGYLVILLLGAKGVDVSGIIK